MTRGGRFTVVGFSYEEIPEHFSSTLYGSRSRKKDDIAFLLPRSRATTKQSQRYITGAATIVACYPQST